jgi:hypothetical protein
MMNELRIVVSQQQGTITTNFDEVKEALFSQMEVYKELEVTEENKAERKKDVATLRKIIKAVNDKRIEVKKECLKPYETFEKQASELVDIINEPVKLIDNQVKEFEDKQRLEKVNSINQFFTELVGELSEHISIEQIYDSKWENVATSNKSIKEDIAAKLNDIRNGVTAIKAMLSEKTEEALNRYYDNLDLASAINFINRYEQQKREIEQRMKEQQERDREAALERERERIRREEREAYAREQRIAAEAETRAKAEQEAKEQTEREAMSVKKQVSGTIDYVYGITATEEEFEQIEMYLNSLGVEFERIG